ncbi:mediator of RNA polymerase II transcription subunit 22 isoform X2 [Bufo bufo]|uniref:mediator of RNA polymerase II transcription subunit 22 isoform X2 n=1 Tax=Bufo bufo TaxID=8384 RepID=UPI001ABE9FD3|nr:mediator of RNA polymerase II transcription subunit 22 isoform X2 [Bufo bufo]
MAQQRVLPQSKETLLQSYNKRLKDDIKSIMDNFTEIIKSARIEEEHQVSRSTQGEQDNYEMHVRSANIVRAGESLMRLVSDLKQYLILNDFPSVNEAINQRNQQLRALQEDCDKKLISLRDEIAIDLYELEEEYYSSRLGLESETSEQLSDRFAVKKNSGTESCKVNETTAICWLAPPKAVVRSTRSDLSP